MKRFANIILAALLIAAPCCLQPVMATTAVSHSEKQPRLPKGCTVYGRVLCEGSAMAGVEVSDGKDIVLTDRNGWYALCSDKRNGSVFISIPSCTEVVSDGPRFMPAFWQPLDAATGLERHDFVLRRVDNRRHTILAFTDAHMANIYDDAEQFRNGFMPRVREEIAGQGNVPVYAINIGDSSYDRYWYEDSYTIADFNTTLADNDFPVPVFTVMGNHDNDGATASEPSATVDFRAEEAYRKAMGPVWYSFNLGDVHYVTLDNIVYKNSPGRIDDCEGIAGKRDYEVYFTREQLDWLRKDLDLVQDKDTPVVVAVHSPVLAYKTGDGGRIITRFKCSTAPADSLADAFFSMFKDFRQVHFLTGHTHKNLTCHGSDDTSKFPAIGNIIDHNITSVCGCWWHTSAYGGLQLAPDSGPAGFEMFPVDGRDISWYFVSSDDGAGVQFRVFDLNGVRDYYRNNGEARSLLAHHPEDFRNYADVEDNLIQVHVWAWEPGWRVSVRELPEGVSDASSQAGVELSLVQKRAENPQFTVSYDIPKMNWRDGWPGKKYKAAIQPHMFTAKASSATSTVIVSVTDNFGRTYTQTVERPKAFSKRMR